MTRIDIFSEAFTTKGGDPQPATLFGIDFNVKRDFTADDVRTYIESFNFTRDDIPSPEEQIRFQLGFLTDLAGKNLDAVVAKLLEADLLITTKCLIQLGVVAGLRSEDGNFTPGRKR